MLATLYIKGFNQNAFTKQNYIFSSAIQRTRASMHINIYNVCAFPARPYIYTKWNSENQLTIWYATGSSSSKNKLWKFSTLQIVGEFRRVGYAYKVSCRFETLFFLRAQVLAAHIYILTNKINLKNTESNIYSTFSFCFFVCAKQ